MRHRTIVALAITTALGTACGGGGSASPDPGGSAGAGLDGRTFLSTQVEGRAFVAGTLIRLSFQDGRVGADAGCNSIGGSYALDGDRLVVGDLITTEIGCDPLRMEQDRWVTDLLDGAAVALDGDTLRLTKGGIRVTFLDRRVADPDRPLLGTRWLLEGLVTGGAVASVQAGVVAALTFAGDRVDVEAGCNRGGGSVRISDRRIEFGPIGLTKMACAAGIMAVEQAVTAALRGTVGYIIEADVLTLDSGGTGLILRAAP